MGGRRIRQSDRRGRATRVGAQPILDFSLSDLWSADPTDSEFSSLANITFPAGKTRTTTPIGIRDDEVVGEGTNTITWTLNKKAAFGFKKEVYIFSEDDDTNPALDQPTFKPIKLIKGGSIKAVTILIEDNDGSRPSVRGTNKNDTLIGTDEIDTLYGVKGNDSLSGLDGDDSLYGFAGDDDINGGRGDDYIAGHAGRDRLLGVIGNDVIDGGEGRDTINGGHGNDRLFGWFDNDTLIGEKGNDELYGESGDDVLEGGIGNDILDGGTGKNTLSTGDGNDIIVVDKKGLSVVRDFELGSDRLQLTQNLPIDAKPNVWCAHL